MTAVMDIAGRAAETYLQMYESLAEEQQTARLEDMPIKASRAGYWASVVRGAIDYELHDPEPRDDPYRLCCTACTVWMATRGGR